MSSPKDPSAGASRDRARARLRKLTSAALFATTGATVAIGIVVAHEHPGKSATSTTTSDHSTGGSTTSSSGSTDNTGSSGESGSSGNTGNSGASSFSPSISSRTPSVTSGGTSR